MMKVPKKSITLDDLAAMVAEGFNGVEERFQGLEGRMGSIEGRMGSIEGRMGSMEERMDKLEHEMEGLRNSVNNYLRLSDKRYLELKYRQSLIIKWIKKVAEKVDVKIDFKELEKEF